MRGTPLYIAVAHLAALASAGWSQCPLDALAGSAASTGDGMGLAVRFDGDRAVVGAYLDDPSGDGSGSAYVFRRTSGGWIEEAYLVPSDGQAGDQFGTSLDISGDVIVVGAWRRASDRGTAYVFRFDGAGWVEEARLDPLGGEQDDRIAESVAVEGDVIVLGAAGDDDNCGTRGDPGAAYVYRYDGASWIEEAKLLDPDCEIGERFGVSVSISGPVILVGAWQDVAPSQPRDSGSATFFRHDGAGWVVEQKVWAFDAGLEQWFGWATAVDGDTAVITARHDDDVGRESGSAYVYQYDGMTGQWSLDQKLVSADAGAFAELGFSAAIDGDLLLLGAFSSSFAAANAGAAIPFRREGPGNWVQLEPLVADPAASGDAFGFSVDLLGARAIVGAPGYDDRREDDGQAFLYDLAPSCDCPADLTGDGILDIFDFLEFQNLFAMGDPRADFTGDGVLDLFDFLEFQNAFGRGCP
ncbi:MAG: GC-type dockerin domain-anchored protein [Phycisphaerales bacterium JB039]